MTENSCPFCRLTETKRVFYQDDVIAVLWDGYAVSPGHALVVPRRHVATWFDATEEERSALLRGIDIARDEVLRRYTDPAPEGFNIGINVGAAAGQTVFHLHVHFIPRYAGDVPDPRGGVRHVIPSKGNYFVGKTGTEAGAEPDGAVSHAVDEDLRITPAGEPGTMAEPEPEVQVTPLDGGGGEAGEPGRSAGPGEPGGSAKPAGPAKPYDPADAAGPASPRVHFHPRYVHPILKRPPLVRGDGDELGLVLREQFDRSTRVDVAVAFTMESGVALVEDRIRALLDRGGVLRFLTGDYLGATDPDALEWLLSLVGNLELKAFEAAGTSFHPKAYIFHEADGTGTGFVGSSNLTRIALTSGVEWNYGLAATTDPDGYRDVAEAFETLFAHERAKPLTQAWIDEYRRRRPRLVQYPRSAEAATVGHEPPEPPHEPHEVQREALLALEQSREDGNEAGLVVLATGLGKTWLAAFDSSRPEYRRVLFVAHRAEILAQARDSFRRMRPNASFGFYSGQERSSEAEVLFASIQTIGRQNHLDQFARDAFDYIVVDEFHHAAAPSYSRLIDHFQPKFLLGLTATPERTDGGRLLALCDENLVYRCDLGEGIARELLSPYHYFGVPDVVDYAQIPWRSTRFDEEALTTAVATEARAGNALEQWRKRAGTRTLAFCVSQRHADFMKKHFQSEGIPVAAVHSGPTSDPRKPSIDALKKGDIAVLFAVDMFNEGLDVPEIDTVLMLRPTESKIIWLQQFGRGLRRADDKPYLTVIDYIGNHRVFLTKPQALLGLAPNHAELREALKRIASLTFGLPPGCEVTYELEAIEILRQLSGGDRKPAEALSAYYSEFVEQHGVRPRAVEAFHDGFNPRSARDDFGSWLGFVKSMGGMSADELEAFDAARVFFEHLEKTPMEKSYKMLVLEAMLARDAFPGSISIDDLVDGFAAAARRSAELRADVDVLDDPVALRRRLLEMPVAKWVAGRGMGGVSYFELVGDDPSATAPGTEASAVRTAPGTETSAVRYVFRTTRQLDALDRDAAAALAREIVEWRIASYLDRAKRSAKATAGIVCKVSHTNGRPIVFLDRRRYPDTPEGWTGIVVGHERYKANFVKIALNVVRKDDAGPNVLPDILREFFGERAGLPGTRHFVDFEKDGTWIRMRKWEEDEDEDEES